MKTLVKQAKCSIGVGETFVIGDREKCSVYIRIPDEEGIKVVPSKANLIWCTSLHSGNIYGLPKEKVQKVKPIAVDYGTIIFSR